VRPDLYRVGGDALLLGSGRQDDANQRGTRGEQQSLHGSPPMADSGSDKTDWALSVRSLQRVCQGLPHYVATLPRGAGLK
jgi:hypothetical protein